MQLVVVLPMPALKVSPLLPAPFVTAVQWDPEGIQRDVTQDVSSTAHLQLAAGDRHGRIAIWDVAAGEWTKVGKGFRIFVGFVVNPCCLQQFMVLLSL
jgi:uncharacterized cupin superfamily protein